MSLETKRRFLSKSRREIRMRARAEGRSRAEAAEAARKVTDEQLEAAALEAVKKEGDTETTPTTLWERIQKFWKNWGPLIRQVASILLPIVIGMLSVSAKIKAKDADPVREIYFNEFLALLADDDDDGSDPA